MDDRGFTLIELVLVLVLVAILGAIALPAFGALVDRFLLEEAAWRLARDLRQVQQLAVTKEEWYQVQFQYSLNRYVIRRSNEVWSTVQLPQGVEMEETSFSRHEVFFFPTGSPSMGGTVPLVNRRGERLFIKVTVAAGRIRVSSER